MNLFVASTWWVLVVQVFAQMQQQSMRKQLWASCISCSSSVGRGNNESAAAANKGKSKVAVVRGVPDSFANALTMEKPASPVNLERAREQHAAYVQILRGTFSTTTCSKKLMAIKHQFFFRVKILVVKKLASQFNASFLGWCTVSLCSSIFSQEVIPCIDNLQRKESRNQLYILDP
jgi:hypothetical protein